MGQSITASVYNVNGKMIVCSKDPFNPDGKPVCAKDKTNEFSQILIIPLSLLTWSPEIQKYLL